MGLYSKIKRKFSGKSKEKPSGEGKGGNTGSSPSATAAADPSSPPTTVAQGSASEPANVSQVAPSIAQPASRPASSSPAPAPSVPIEPTVPDTPAAPLSHDLDPWARAYEIFQDRQPELVADYKKHLASLQDDAAASTDLSTPRSIESIVKQLLKDREKKQWRVPLLGKDIKAREQAERLAKFLIWSDPIVKSAVSAQPYAALAWSGVSLLLPLLTSGTVQNEAMLKGFNSIIDVQVYWRISEETYLKSQHQQNYQDLVEPLAKLYSYVIEYQARVICHLSSAQLSRAWQKVTDQNNWVSLEGKVNDLSKGCSDCINPLREEELRKNRDSQLQEIQESRAILDEIRRILEESREQTQRNYEKQEERDLLQDLASDYEGYKNFNETRVPGTCEWFFDDDRFRTWRDSDISSLLWVSAGPGCGKSVLSRALIDEGRLSTNVTTSTVCHFFFKDGEKGRMESTNALSAILHQLFIQDPTGSLIRHALGSYQNHGSKLTLNFSELWQILENCARSSDTREIVCILDALDECNVAGRLQLINKLKDFYLEQDQDQSNCRLKLKFLITSRPYDDLEASFRKFSDTTIYLRFDGDNKSKEISQEINLVIDARMDDIAGDFAKDHRCKISERLKSMDHRTYLWLHLTIDIIKQSPSKYGRLYDVENLLSELPTEISDAYEKILGRSKNEKHTEILLQIILAAAQPLTLDEANIALTLALHKEQFLSHAELQSSLWPSKNFQSIVKNLCGLFINVYDSKLSFIHQTAREFLLHPERQGKWKGRLNMPESHSTISRPCLYYLLLPDIATIVKDYGYKNPQYSFFHYAALHWPLHYSSQSFHDTGIGSEKEISALALSLCETGSKRYNAWSSVYASKILYFPIFPSSLSIASYFGFKGIVQLLLATGKVELDSKDKSQRTPLSWAAERGHKEIVQLLLATGKVELDSKDDSQRTPLSWAAESGHKEIVQLLLATGKVELDSKDKLQQTPLSWAAASGHKEIVQLLLATGKVELDSKDAFQQTPLSWAAESGHKEIVQLLLATGKVELDSKDKLQRTPLSWAAIRGHKEIVQLLLATSKVELDSKDDSQRTPLSWAAESGHKEIVQLLLATGKVELDSKDDSQRTPLSYAAGEGHEAVVQVLQKYIN